MLEKAVCLLGNENAGPPPVHEHLISRQQPQRRPPCGAAVRTDHQPYAAHVSRGGLSPRLGCFCKITQIQGLLHKDFRKVSVCKAPKRPSPPPQPPLLLSLSLLCPPSLPVHLPAHQFNLTVSTHLNPGYCGKVSGVTDAPAVQAGRTGRRPLRGHGGKHRQMPRHAPAATPLPRASKTKKLIDVRKGWRL